MTSPRLDEGQRSASADLAAASAALGPSRSSRPRSLPPAAAGGAIAPSRSGLRLAPELAYDAWKAIGIRLSVRSEASSWWLGDWLVFGQEHYGRRYKQAIEVTGLDYQTLRNYAVVARRFHPSRRRDNLSFQHHAEVCALPDDAQGQWLDLATTKNWSKRELRTQLRETVRKQRGQTNHFELRVQVDRSHEDRWRQAATRAGCSLEDWVRSTLDSAS